MNISLSEIEVDKLIEILEYMVFQPTPLYRSKVPISEELLLKKLNPDHDYRLSHLKLENEKN
jgi:hypothetical protein